MGMFKGIILPLCMAVRHRGAGDEVLVNKY